MVKLNLPMIPVTKPGDNYGLNINADQLDGARIFKSRIDLMAHCRGLLPLKPSVCELGVYHGDFSEQLLSHLDPERLFLVDTKTELIKESIKANEKVIVLAGRSWERLAAFPNQSLDYLYIDADHSYYAVRNDLMIGHHKMKPGGIIQFNDYCTYSPGERIEYGVLQVVNAYLEHHNPKLVGVSLDRSGYHDIALQVPQCS